MVVVVVLGVVRLQLLDAGGDAPHWLHVGLWGRPAPRPSLFAPPSPHGSHAPSCLFPRAHGALALALGSLPRPRAFVPLSALRVLPPVTRALACPGACPWGWGPGPPRLAGRWVGWGGGGRAAAPLPPFWVAACGTPSWPPSRRQRTPLRPARAVGVAVPARGGEG